MITLTGRKAAVSVDESMVRALLPDLAFLRFYDAAPRGRVNSLDPIDWAVPSLLSAPVPYKVLKQVSPEYLAKVDVSLRACKTSWRLEEEDVNAIRREAVRRVLIDICAVRGVKRGIATKMLHKKRPDLIPIVDSVVFGFYASGKVKTTEVIFDAVRPDLIANMASLTTLADEASAFSQPGRISPLRMLEMIVWLQAKEGGDRKILAGA